MGKVSEIEIMINILMISLLLIGITGVLNGFFLFFYLFFGYSKKNPADKYLAFLVLFITVRMAKSIIASIVPVDFIVIHTGLAAFACVGPVLLLYISKSINPQRTFTKIKSLHFAPAILVLSSAFLPYPQNDPVWDIRYNLIMIQIAVYIFLAGYHFRKKKDSSLILPHPDKWYLFVIGAVALIWLSYGITWWTGVLPYLSATVLFCLFVYMLFFLWRKKNQINESFEKYRNSILTKPESQALFQKLMTVMINTKPFLDNDITLSKLALQLETKPYLLSQVINENFYTNFFDFINAYRVDEVKVRLISPEYTKLTIAAIAYDCGFNSISSFNSAFKKKEKVSPRKYREENTH